MMRDPSMALTSAPTKHGLPQREHSARAHATDRTHAFGWSWKHIVTHGGPVTMELPPINRRQRRVLILPFPVVDTNWCRDK
jgi:hypothetical protein